MASNETQMFDKDGVVSTMNAIGDSFQNVSTAYEKADSRMAEDLTTPDGAMYGEGATKILSAWDENSGTLKDFMATFENWAALVSGMANQFTNLEEGTYKVKQDVNINDIANKARSFHTTALKTEAGKTAFAAAQSSYYAKHKDSLSYDENGAAYTSIKKVENGRIIDTKVYYDENGNIKFVEETRWNSDKLEFETVYYSGGEVKNTGTAKKPNWVYDPTTATQMTKTEFEKAYYNDETVKQQMKEYWQNKYGAEYLKDPNNMSEEAKKAFDKLPASVREELKNNLDEIKGKIDGTNGKHEYDENGNLKSVTYTGEDGKEYKIEYKYDDNGNLIETNYYIDNVKRDPNDTDVMNKFYEGIKGSTNSSTTNTTTEEEEGSGTTGGTSTTTNVTDDTTNQTSSWTNPEENGKTYELGKNENGETTITVDGKEYKVVRNPDGSLTFMDEYGKVSGDKADELAEAYKNITDNSNYAKALAGETEGATTYGLDENGNVVTKTTIPAGTIPGVGEGELTVTYDENGNPTSYTYDDGTRKLTLSTEEYNALMNQGKTTDEEGHDVTYSIDTNDGSITKTTSDGDNILSEEKTYRDIEGNITKTETTYYDENNDAVSQETTENGETTYKYRDSKTGELIDVSEEHYNKLTGKTSEDGVTYSIEDGAYTETTAGTDPNKPQRVHKEYDDGHTSDKELQEDGSYKTTEDYNDGHKYTITEEDGKKPKFDVDGTNVTENQYHNLQRGSSTDDGTNTKTTYSLEDDGNGGKVYTETTTQNVGGKEKPYSKYQEYSDHSTLEEYNDDGTSKVTEHWKNPGTDVDDYTYNKNHTFVMEKDKNGNTTSYSYDGTTVNKEQYDKLKTPLVSSSESGKSTRREIVDGKYTETTFENGNPDKIYEKQIQDKNGNTISTETTTYDSNGNKEETIIKGKDLKPHNNNNNASYEGTQVIKYNEDGTISQETITNDNNGSYVSYEYDSSQNVTKSVIKNSRETTTIDYTDGKMSSKTVEKSTGDKSEYTFDSNEILTNRKDTHPNGSYEEYKYDAKGENKEIVAREVVLNDGTTYGFDESGKSHTNNPKYSNYQFSKEQINQIAESGISPTYMYNTSRENKQDYINFLNNAEEGSMITFENGGNIQYDLSPGDTGYELTIQLDPNSAYVVKDGKLINVDNPDEYYYIDALKSEASTNEYGKDTESKMTYEELQVMRENYGEGGESYDESKIKNWTVYQGVQNHSEPIEPPPGNPTETTPKNITIKDSNGNTVNNLKEEGIVDNIVKNPEDYTYTMSIDYKTCEFKYENGYYTYRDGKGKTMIFDPATGKVYVY